MVEKSQNPTPVSDETAARIAALPKMGVELDELAVRLAEHDLWAAEDELRDAQRAHQGDGPRDAVAKAFDKVEMHKDFLKDFRKIVPPTE